MARRYSAISGQSCTYQVLPSHGRSREGARSGSRASDPHPPLVLSAREVSRRNRGALEEVGAGHRAHDRVERTVSCGEEICILTDVGSPADAVDDLTAFGSPIGCLVAAMSQPVRLERRRRVYLDDRGLVDGLGCPSERQRSARRCAQIVEELERRPRCTSDPISANLERFHPNLLVNDAVRLAVEQIVGLASQRSSGFVSDEVDSEGGWPPQWGVNRNQSRLSAVQPASDGVDDRVPRSTEFGGLDHQLRIPPRQRQPHLPRVSRPIDADQLHVGFHSLRSRSTASRLTAASDATMQEVSSSLIDPRAHRSRELGVEALTRTAAGDLIVPMTDEEWDSWVSASATRNHVLDNPLLDWFARYGEAKGYERDGDHTIDPRTDFLTFIFDRGNGFEEAVVEHLRTLADVHVPDGAEGGYEARRDLAVAEATVALMADGVPVVYQGVLRDAETQTYGAPDLLVRADVLHDLFPRSFSADAAAIPAPDLAGLDTHYVVVDIKFSMLNLAAGGELGNSGSAPAYKVQLFIYNRALGRLQGFTPPNSFILGRGWEQTLKGETQRVLSCMDRLGPVAQDYASRGRGAAKCHAAHWYS